MSDLICKFCGSKLSRPGPGSNHIFIGIPVRRDIVKSVAGIECNPGECLNAAGQLTKHHPNASEWNGGLTVYEDSRPLGEAWL